MVRWAALGYWGRSWAGCFHTLEETHMDPETQKQRLKTINVVEENRLPKGQFSGSTLWVYFLTVRPYESPVTRLGDSQVGQTF